MFHQRVKKEIIIIDEAKHALGFYVDFDKCQNEVFKNIKDVFKIKKYIRLMSKYKKMSYFMTFF